MSFVTQLSKMINVKSWNNIVPSPGGSSDKILYFLFSPVSFLISTDPVMSKFVPVIPTVVINIFPIDVYYCHWRTKNADIRGRLLVALQ